MDAAVGLKNLCIVDEADLLKNKGEHGKPCSPNDIIGFKP
jgi:hypothetical protein